MVSKIAKVIYDDIIMKGLLLDGARAGFELIGNELQGHFPGNGYVPYFE